MLAEAETKRPVPLAAQELTVELVAPETLNSAPVSGVLRYWKSKRGSRRFPARADISPRELASFLRNVVIIRVVDGGADYEYRIAGDAYVLAFGMNFKGVRLTQIEARDAFYGASTRAAYEHVRASGEPFALRGWVAPTAQSAFSYHETIFLPLGENDVVDHILAVSAFTPRGNVLEFTDALRPLGGELPPASNLHLKD